VSLDLTAGQFSAVMCPLGSDTSTLLHCMAALDTPTSGTILIWRHRLSQPNEKQLTRLRRDRIGIAVVLAGLAGVLAAVIPAGSAARIDILRAGRGVAQVRRSPAREHLATR